MAASSVNWEPVSPNPSEEEITYIPTGITKENYIAINNNCITKYNFETDNWNKLMNIPNNAAYNRPNILINDEYSLCAIDTNTKEIWFYDDSDLTQIQLHGNYGRNDIRVGKEIGVVGKGIFINKKFYIIGGSANNCIICWVNNQFIDVVEMYGKARLSCFGLVHHPLKNSLFIFGGYDYFKCKYMNSILEYNVSQNKWYKLPVTLPNAMWECACTMAIHNKYVLIFGGTGADIGGEYNDILIYSFKAKTIRISKVKAPLTALECNAITVNDNKKDEKIVFGYVRDTWKSTEMKSYTLPPYYLFKLIHSFYLNESVYLLEKHGSRKHWKLSTLDIV